VHLRHVCQLRERVGVPERHKDDPVVGIGRERREEGAFLTAAVASRGHKHARVLAGVPAFNPDLAGRVPEGLRGRRRSLDGKLNDEWSHLPLRREVTIASGHAKHEGVVFFKDGGSDNRDIRFGRRVHLLQHIFREGFRDSKSSCTTIDEMRNGKACSRTH
jgi:hypothetical protein